MESGEKSSACRLPAWHSGNELLLLHQPGSTEQFSPFCGTGRKRAAAASPPSCSEHVSLLTPLRRWSDAAK